MGIWLGVAAIVAALLAVAVFYPGRQTMAPQVKGPATTPAAATSGKTAIAVLPFTDLSANKDQEYFADGLAEELLNVLAKNPKLRVTSRTSAFSFKGKEVHIKKIAEELNVTHILEGSVRKAGNELRITAQLIEVASDSHLWSQTYDRHMENIFAVQDDIAASVAGALKSTLEGGQTSKTQQTNPEAFNAYLQGRYFLERRTEEDLEKAIGYFEQALQIDPTYARAWVGLSETHYVQAGRVFVPIDEGYRKARKEAEKALEIDPNVAEAHASLGRIKMVYDWDWVDAEASYQRALELDPANAKVVRSAAALAATLGRYDEAITLDRRAIALDPLWVAAHYYLGLDACYARRWSEAEAALRKALELNPQYPGAHTVLGLTYLERSKPEEALMQIQKEPDPFWRDYGLALAYHAAGKKQEADAALKGIIEEYPNEATFQIAEIYSYQGEKDKAFEWLERAYKQHDPGLSQIKGDPLLRNLERDPRYRAFLQKMKLPVD